MQFYIFQLCYNIFRKQNYEVSHIQFSLFFMYLVINTSKYEKKCACFLAFTHCMPVNFLLKESLCIYARGKQKRIRANVYKIPLYIFQVMHFA